MAQTNRKSGEENVRITEIPDSPFKHVKQDAKEFIVLGNHIVHECNLLEALKLVKNKDWDIIVNTMLIILNKLVQESKTLK